MEKTPTATILVLALLTAPALAGGVASSTDDEPSLWLPEHKLERESQTSGGQHGWSVDLGADWALVGAPASESVTVYKAGNDSWAQAATLEIDSTAGESRFGYSLALEGSTAIVGAPDISKAFVFTEEDGAWMLSQVLRPDGVGPGDHFGWDLALDDGVAIVTAPHAHSGGVDRAGEAYAFSLESGSWSQEAVLSASEPEFWGFFGWSVDLDEGTVALGQIGDGTVHVFDRETGVWSPSASLSRPSVEDFARVVSLESGWLAVGAPSDFVPQMSAHTGSVHLFARSLDGWEHEQRLLPDDVDPFARGEEFGQAVSLNPAGTRILVGSPGDHPLPAAVSAPQHERDEACVSQGGLPTCHRPGAAYLFTADQQGWETEAKLASPSEAPAGSSDVSRAAEFGHAVSFAPSRDQVLVGAPYADGEPGDEAGEAYLFSAHHLDPEVAR